MHTLVEPIYVSSPAGLSAGMESDDRMECETWEAKQRLGKIIIIRRAIGKITTDSFYTIIISSNYYST